MRVRDSNPAGGLRFRLVLAVFAARIDSDDPLSGLDVGEIDRNRGARRVDDGVRPRRLPQPPRPLVAARRRAAGGPAADDPRAATRRAWIADGNEVIVHCGRLLGRAGAATRRSTRAARCSRSAIPGTFAERVAVPRRNLVPKPPELSFEEAACLPTAWLTAYRMLFTRAAVAPGLDRPRAGRGRRRGHRADRARARGGAAGVGDQPRPRRSARARSTLGADAVFEPGARLPERVDAVIETVGAATWDHSLKALKPGGTLVVSGATSRRRPARVA